MSGIEARLAEVLAEHRMLGRSFGKVDACGCGWLAPWSDSHPAYRAHVAATLAVVVAEEVTAACEAAALAIERNGKVCRDAHGPNCVGHAAYTDAAYLARAAAPPSSIGSGVGGQGGVGL